MSGGIRAVEQLRQVVVELEMIPIIDSLAMLRIRMLFDEKGKITDSSYDKRLGSVIDALVKWTNSLKKIRSDLSS